MGTSNHWQSVLPFRSLAIKLAVSAFELFIKFQKTDFITVGSTLRLHTFSSTRVKAVC